MPYLQMSQSFQLIIILNKIIIMDLVSGYVNHSLNNSKTKAAFSFPREARLKDDYRSINHSFYELPSERSKRACSLGYGNKISLGKKTVGPPPDAYQIRSTFEKNSYSSIAFGKSRENIKFGNFLQVIDRARKLPAPNSYKNRISSLNKKGGRIGLRLPTDIDQLTKKKTPGPGQYEPKHLNVSDLGQYFLSKYKNLPSPRYHNPEHQMKNSKARISTIGPGTYEADSKFGKSILSQFRNSVAGTIPKSQRQGVVQKAKLKFPGFKYRSFSEFGQVKQ